MSTTPEDQSRKELHELDGDDSAAQRALAHVPQPRASVEVQGPTIIVQQEVDADSPRELVPYTANSTDPTLVVRSRREAAGRWHWPAVKLPPGSSIALWIGLSALAFAIGGAIALIGIKQTAPNAPSSGGLVSIPPVAHAASRGTASASGAAGRAMHPVTATRAGPTPRGPVQPEASTKAAPVPELSPSDLPVLPRHKPRRPRVSMSAQPEQDSVPSDN